MMANQCCICGAEMAEGDQVCNWCKASVSAHMPVMRAKGGRQVTDNQAICALEELRFWAKDHTVKLGPVQFDAIEKAIIALKTTLETADSRAKNNGSVPEVKDEVIDTAQNSPFKEYSVPDGQKRDKPVHDSTTAFDWFFQDVFGLNRAKDGTKTRPKQGVGECD